MSVHGVKVADRDVDNQMNSRVNARSKSWGAQVSAPDRAVSSRPMPSQSDSDELTDEAFGVIPILRQGTAVLFLVIQHNAGHWAFPKGHAERGEDEATAALRELFEETGIRDVTLDRSRIFVEQYTKSTRGSARLVRKTVRYFLGTVADPTVRLQPEEIRDHRWVTFAEARKLITYAQSRRLLEDAAQALGIWSSE